jgi:S1-C subfamily serine protease
MWRKLWVWPAILMVVGCAAHGGNVAPAVNASDARPLLGIVPDLASVDSHVGVLIAGTTPGTPAAVGGLQAGDLLVKFGIHDVQNLDDLTKSLANAHAGDQVSIIVLRASHTVEVDVVLAPRKG